jgi:hypothetical protein
MAIKISKKIKSYSVQSADDKAREAAQAAAPVVDAPAARPSAEVIQMHETARAPRRADRLHVQDQDAGVGHAMYVTINDIVLNEGTEHEQRRPFEIFINSKNLDHFQWIVALTRIMSAVFRKGGDVTFLVDELKAVFDPRGGYFKAGGVYMPSIVAEIGAVIEAHLKMIGMIVDDELSPEQQALIAEKRAAYEASLKKNPELTPNPTAPATTFTPSEPSSGFPPGATMCHKCNTQALVVMDGCQTCLNCGYSKCG